MASLVIKNTKYEFSINVFQRVTIQLFADDKYNAKGVKVGTNKINRNLLKDYVPDQNQYDDEDFFGETYAPQEKSYLNATKLKSVVNPQYIYQ